jgi:hypothetical protein
MRCLALALILGLAAYGALTYGPKKNAAELPLPRTGLYVNGEFVPGHFVALPAQPNGSIGYKFVPDRKPAD